MNITVALVRVAGASYRSAPEAIRPQLVQRLASGPNVDYATLKELSRQADRYTLAVLKEAGVEPGKQVESLGALSPSPPNYTDPLIEVIERLAEEPAAAAALPRAADWNQAGTELGADLGGVPVLGANVAEVDRLQRLVATFLEGQIKLPREILSGVLLRKDATDRTAGPARGGDDPANADAATGSLFEADSGKAASGTGAR